MCGKSCCSAPPNIYTRFLANEHQCCPRAIYKGYFGRQELFMSRKRPRADRISDLRALHMSVLFLTCRACIIVSCVVFFGEYGRTIDGLTTVNCSIIAAGATSREPSSIVGCYPPVSCAVVSAIPAPYAAVISTFPASPARADLQKPREKPLKNGRTCSYIPASARASKQEGSGLCRR